MRPRLPARGQLVHSAWIWAREPPPPGRAHQLCRGRAPDPLLCWPSRGSRCRADGLVI